jgi:hypothetical protein
MNYSDALNRSFRTLRSRALWGFAATVTGARVALMLVALASVYYGVGADGISRAVTSTPLWGMGTDAVVAQIGYFAAVAIGAVLAIPVNLVGLGGLTHLGDEVLSGRDARVGEGWTFGGQWIGRVFLIELATMLITLGVSLACLVPLVILAAGGVAGSVAMSTTSNSSMASAVPMIAGFCCGYLLFLLLLVLATIFVVALREIALRYALVGGRTAGDALGSAWKAVRARRKNIFVFALILMGLTLLWLAVASIVLVPVGMATSPGAFGGAQGAETLGGLLGAYAISGPLTALLALPLMIFASAAWTAFFRQMTGLDVVATNPPTYAPVAHGYAPSTGVGGVYPPQQTPVEAPGGESGSAARVAPDEPSANLQPSA